MGQQCELRGKVGNRARVLLHRTEPVGEFGEILYTACAHGRVFRLRFKMGVIMRVLHDAIDEIGSAQRPRRIFQLTDQFDESGERRGRTRR